MSDVELAINRCKAIESLLAHRLGASGRGLHEKTTSIAGRLPEATVRQLRFIASVRNVLVHEADQDQIDDRAGFIRACDEAEREIRAAPNQPAGRKRRMIIAVIVFAIFTAAVVYLSLRT